MNIKLQKLIYLFNERKNFFNNHPDSYKFMKNTFGEKLPMGTEIQVIVKKPQGDESSTVIMLQNEVDEKVFDSLSDIFCS